MHKWRLLCWGSGQELPKFAAEAGFNFLSKIDNLNFFYNSDYQSCKKKLGITRRKKLELFLAIWNRLIRLYTF